MKNFKFLFFIILLFPGVSYGQNSLIVKWGLESTHYFKEIQKSKKYIFQPEEGDSLYRFFTVKQNYGDMIVTVFARHGKLWDIYLQSIGEDSESDRDDFNIFAESEDPYYLGLTETMAPVLYFDFIGLDKEYVLETIEIETIDFAEYKGGGFYQNNAWYDIELKHEIGTYIYNVNKKLRFVGSGRTKLRFWSDNYYKNVSH